MRLKNIIRIISSNLRYQKRRKYISQNKGEKTVFLTPMEDGNRIYSSKYDDKEIKISFACSMRYKGNDDSNPNKFFDSLIMETKNLKTIEIVIIIDVDDEIEFFTDLVELYQNLVNIKLIVSNKNYGYDGLHLYDKVLYKNLSPYTRMICDFSDDCTIVKKDWDLDLLKIDQKYEDNIYFINSSKCKYRKLMPDYKEISIIYFIYLYAVAGPGSYFPVFSKRVLDIANESLANVDDPQNWSPVANNFMVDCCVDFIANNVKMISGIDRINQVNFIQITQQSTKKEKVNAKLSSRDKGYIAFTRDKALKHFENIAKNIIKEFKE